jgi:hypothetical protein
LKMSPKRQRLRKIEGKKKKDKKLQTESNS